MGEGRPAGRRRGHWFEPSIAHHQVVAPRTSSSHAKVEPACGRSAGSPATSAPITTRQGWDQNGDFTIVKDRGLAQGPA